MITAAAGTGNRSPWVRWPKCGSNRGGGCSGWPPRRTPPTLASPRYPWRRLVHVRPLPRPRDARPQVERGAVDYASLPIRGARWEDLPGGRRACGRPPDHGRARVPAGPPQASTWPSWISGSTASSWPSEGGCTPPLLNTPYRSLSHAMSWLRPWPAGGDRAGPDATMTRRTCEPGQLILFLRAAALWWWAA